MRSAARAILIAAGGEGVQMVPVTIVTVSPLTVNLNGTTVTCMRVLGATYTVGAPAVAFLNPPNSPVVLPIGA